jgi:hypothetical protein
VEKNRAFSVLINKRLILSGEDISGNLDDLPEDKVVAI